jgi:tellurite resistance protein
LGIFDAIKSLAGNATEAIDKYSSKQNSEAVLAIMYGAAHADGDYGEKEKAKIGAGLTRHQMLKKFSVAEHNAFIRDKLEDGFEFDVSTGLDACRKEVRDIRTKPYEERVTVILAGVIAAKAEGDGIGPEELEFLRSCADAAEVKYSDVGL